ncbi:MAG: substrate-binding domain-containing protein, partial [Clostridiales bacterium]|nr:substrate-binding domain-containing protein [Clostridiales bacterium]
MKKRKVLGLIIAVCMVLTFAVGCSSGGGNAGGSPTAPGGSPTAPGGSPTTPAPAHKTIGVYADASDSYYSLLNDALQACAKQDPEVNWTIDYKVGDSTANGQLSAVQDFITAGYDAVIVIQNNPNTTSQCITLCKAAGIPYFGAVHDYSEVANAKDSAGNTSYDFEAGGVMAGQDAMARGISKVIMIEGVLGQG